MSRPPEPWRHEAQALAQWMASRDYKGADPFDGACSPLARPFLGLRWVAVGWIQLHRRLPVNLRPWVGVPALPNPKTLALALDGHRAMGDPQGKLDDVALRLLALQNPDGGWGYPFPWANRHFSVPAGTSASVPTVFSAHALLNAVGELSPPLALRAHQAARGAAEFLAHRLNQIPAPGGVLLSYTPLDHRGVHNASLLSASVLARVGVQSDSDFVALARSALNATLAAQRPDGLWPYGLTRRDAWVDGYHTGYILNALVHLKRDLKRDLNRDQDSDLDATLTTALHAGFHGWRDTFLAPEGVVRYRSGRTHPIEAHGMAQGILTLLQFRDLAPDALEQAASLGHWCMNHLALSGGGYAIEQGRWVRNPVRYMRWVQAWMFRAFAELAAVKDSVGVVAVEPAP